MNELLSVNQTSGYDWSARRGSRLYHRQRSAATSRAAAVQLADLAGLEAQMFRYEDEQRKLIETIRTLYVFQDDRAVPEFLSRHRTIPPILAEASRHLREFFKDAV